MTACDGAMYAADGRMAVRCCNNDECNGRMTVRCAGDDAAKTIVMYDDGRAYAVCMNAALPGVREGGRIQRCGGGVQRQRAARAVRVRSVVVVVGARVRGRDDGAQVRQRRLVDGGRKATTVPAAGVRRSNGDRRMMGVYDGKAHDVLRYSSLVSYSFVRLSGVSGRARR